MHIRPATALAAILTIYNEAVLNSTASLAYEADTLTNLTAWLMAVEHNGLVVLVKPKPLRVKTGLRGVE